MKSNVRYDYRNFLLADVSDFGYASDQEFLSEDGQLGFVYDERLYSSKLETLLKNVAASLKSVYIQSAARRFEGGFIQIFAESKRLEIGLDERGVRPAIFVRAKNYESGGRTTECKIVMQFTKGFRHLLGDYPNLWLYPSSPYTAFSVGWIKDDGKPVARKPVAGGSFV